MIDPSPLVVMLPLKAECDTEDRLKRTVPRAVSRRAGLAAEILGES